MNIDTSRKDSYTSICICIDTFEKAALKSETRSGLLAVAHGSTYPMDVILESQERSLNRVSKARESLNRDTGSSSGGVVSESPSESVFQKLRESQGTPAIPLVSEDVDFAALFGNSDSKFANYLEECIGCSLRLKFDWQLQPINFLGPINGFLDQMELALDKLLASINPFKILEDICWALNHLATLCPQDIILVMMGIKALLKRYLMLMFNIKLDWTVLLGPLLKALVSALTDLLDNILALLMAPLDCALSGLKAANDLLHASQDFVASIQGAGSQVGDFFNNVGNDGLLNTTVDTQASGLLGKNVSWGMNTPETLPVNGDQMTVLDPGQLEVSSPISLSSPTPEDAFKLPTGFILTSNATVKSALDDPSFVNATWLEKMIIPLQEAIAWIRETFDKFLGSLHSLETLVGGGISASLDNIGILLFLKDIIALLILIYKLISSNLNIKDWCSFLQANPQVLENAFSPGFKNASVLARGSGDNTELVVKQGPLQVAVIKTCVNSRSSSEQSILASWIKTAESLNGIAI